MLLLTFITPVEIGLSIGFLSTLVGSLWFCLTNYTIEMRDLDGPAQKAE